MVGPPSGEIVGQPAKPVDPTTVPERAMFGYEPESERRSASRRKTLRILTGVILGAAVVFLVLAML